MNASRRPLSRDSREADGDAHYRQLLRDHVEHDMAGVPPLGEGDTWARFCYLRDIARSDLSLARLLEGHLDATAILREAGRTFDKRATYAIWASGGPHATTRVLGRQTGAVMTGTKPFCSGADLVDCALVHTDRDAVLVEVDVAETDTAIVYRHDEWAASAFADIHTWTCEFDETPLAPDAQIKTPRWYFQRSGFWQGAVGPAACWAGGAIGLIDYAREHCGESIHARTHFGALLAAERSMNSSLKCAADDIDRDPADRLGEAYPRALAVRHSIERLCHEVMDRFGRLFGPRPLAYNAQVAQHHAELTLYVRQCHAERDLEELGSHVLQAQ